MIRGHASQLLRFAFVPLFALITLQVCSTSVLSKATPPSRGHQFTILQKTGSQTNWPQLGFDAGHSGNNPYETVLNTSDVGNLQQAWSFSTGSQNRAGNVVYANGVLYAASANGTLFAIDASTGKLLWKYPGGTGYGTSGSVAAVDSGTVFTVCTLRPSGNQGMCALNASTGALVWSYLAPGKTSYAETAPVVANGNVYFGACGSSCAYTALNETNGRVVWSKAQGGGCSLNGGSPPAVYKGKLFAGVGCANGSVIALSAKHGRMLWSQTVHAGSVDDVSAAGGLLGVTGSSFFGVLSATTGDTYWHDSGCSLPGMPTFAYQNVFVPCNFELSAYEARSAGKHGAGVKVWENGGNQAAIANGVIYTLLEPSPGNIPGAVAASNGAFLWFAQDTDLANGLPIVVNGVVYGACTGSNVCAWSLPASLRRS
jgi:outer membrane protein assembly factor BamB